ncbi:MULTISPECIES: hypothetical protein [Psychrilyobacter]|nr:MULTISPECIES: hypothetical protein [Psychrilyobacter]
MQLGKVLVDIVNGENLRKQELENLTTTKRASIRSSFVVGFF